MTENTHYVALVFDLREIKYFWAYITFKSNVKMNGSMVFKIHELKMSKTICTVFMIGVIYASLVLVYISFVLPKSFAQTITNPNQTSKTRPPPPQFGPSPELSAQKSASTNKTCTLTPTSIKLKGTPQQTEGPYFVDGMPNRSDIISDPSDGSVQQGIPLHLVIHVYDVNNGSCIPVRGAKVDIWHANPDGIYSAVEDFGTIGKKFLRGYQTTDNKGIRTIVMASLNWASPQSNL